FTCNDAIKNGAETGVDCGGGSCPPCANGQPCNVNVDCQSSLCQFGVCQPGGCPPGTTLCAGTCVNLQSNALNCGACGTGCANNQTCINGTCVLQCAPPTIPCGNFFCANPLTDVTNCGACN